jgi:type I restriction enzyme S subunit
LVPIPPLSEQRAIAHVLRTVQRAKEATERVIQATQELKKSLMYYLFTYGSVPIEEAEKVPLKETEIGLVPEHWEVVRLGEVCLKPQYGFTESATNQRVGPKFLRITDIQNSQVNWNTVPYCEISDELLKRYRLEPGDLLFARIGATTGKTLLIRECPEAIFASYLIRVRVNLNFLLPEFLFYFTQGNLYWSQINTAKGGRLKQGINIPVLSSLLVPLPPISEQRIIARILEAVDKKLQVEEARKQVLDALFNSLLHNLMTAKIRVKDLNLYNIDIIQRR